jgi:hypothetical protein
LKRASNAGDIAYAPTVGMRTNEIGEGINARDRARDRLSKVLEQLHKAAVSSDERGNQKASKEFMIIVYPANTGLKERTLFPSAGINDFVRRLEQAPPYANTATDSAVLRAYNEQTMEKFKVFFGAEVKETHDLLLNRGLRNPALDELYLNPATTHGMRVVADRPQELAEGLPND